LIVKTCSLVFTKEKIIPIDILIRITNGISCTVIEGLLNVKEAVALKDKVLSILSNFGFRKPLKSISISFTSDIEIKLYENAFLDLPIALALLKCSRYKGLEQIDNYAYVGALSRRGELEPLDINLTESVYIESEHNSIIFPYSEKIDKNKDLFLNKDIIFKTNLKDVIDFVM